MTIIRRLMFEVRNWVSALPKYFEPGYHIQKLNEIMTGRQRDDDNSENLPNKRLRTEEDKKEYSQKIRKRNVALLLAYCGVNYHGMQLNTSVRTVESELINALVKADCLSEEASKELFKIHFQRAARTDKGVSAAKQVVSFKIATNFDVEKINTFLPEDVRVLSIRRVTKGFNSKNDCEARTYSYTLPSFALAPELHKEYPAQFRITEEMINKANAVLNTFVGTHNFHNFTSKKLFKDPSAKRFIMSFKAEEPFVDNEEFITLTIKGQSFMLHQIRKMVGYTVSILKGLAPAGFEVNVWKEDKYSVPMVPGLGLVLENLHYNKYNRKFGNDGMHENLTWDELDDEVQSFKKKYILSNIIKTELTEKVMYNWLQMLPFHTFKFSEEKDLKEEKDLEEVEDLNEVKEKDLLPPDTELKTESRI